MILAALLALAACAVVEPPPGGPEDLTAPHLVSVDPDSGVTGLGPLSTVNITFSEKMDRVDAVSWLHFYPPQRIARTKWHGAVRAEVTLEQPFPPDTVIVMEIGAGMKDAHRVVNRRSRRLPLATADSIPLGRLSGVLVMADSAVSNGVVELWAVPPDTLKYFQQTLLRRTVTDATGAYAFDWLPVPGGPWLVRAFADQSGDLKPGGREPQRLLPDTLSTTTGTPHVVAGLTTLYAPDEPGRLRLLPAAVPVTAAPLVAWTMKLTESDSGWVPVLEAGKGRNFTWLAPDSATVVTKVQPGTNRLAVFVDLDRDSTFSAVAADLWPAGLATAPTRPDSLRPGAADSLVTHFLEPWFLVEGIEVEPGLEGSLTMPTPLYRQVPWTAPAPARPDTAAAAAADTAAAGAVRENASDR